jgi:hypothetical protein
LEVQRGEVADTLLTLLNFWTSNGCLLKNPEGYLIGYSSCAKSKKPSKLKERAGSVDYEGYSKD